MLIPAGAVLVLGAIGSLTQPPKQAGSPAVLPAATVAATQAQTTGATPTPVAAPTTVAAQPSEAPTEAAEPADDPYAVRFGAFTEISKSGSGSGVVKLPAGVTAGIVVATHSGSGNFVIKALDENNGMDDLLVNEIGKYSGTTALGVTSEDARLLKVTANGKWTVKIRPIASAPTLPTSGKGDGVFKYDGDSAIVKWTHKGKSNFVVKQTDGTWPDLLINEIGGYTGEVPIGAGPSVFIISADGSWTATPGS